MKTTFSIGVSLAGGGVGDRAYHAIAGLIRAGYAQRVFASSSKADDLPRGVLRTMGVVGRALRYAAFRAGSFQANCLLDLVYDRWVAAQLGPCDLFHGWTMHSLCSLQRATRLGAVTVLDRGMVHPTTNAELMRAEYARWRASRTFYQPRVDRELAELECTDYLFVLSDYARQTYIANGFPSEKLVLIPSGVDIDRFRPGPPRMGDPFRVLFVGEVGLHKGVPYLLQAWERLGWTDAELVLAGHVLPEVGQAVGPLLSLPGVRFPGFVRDVAALYQAADVFCFPSLGEGGARVIYEAMACALAVVTTVEAGGVAAHEREALLCPCRDPLALAEALQRLREDSALRARLGGAARQKIAAYTWARYGQRVAQAYRRLLGEPDDAGGASGSPD